MVIVQNFTNYRIGKQKLSQIAQYVIDELYKSCRDLSVVAVSASRMKRLNNIYRGINKVTDGLSFIYPEDKTAEIILCPQYIAKEAMLVNITKARMINTVLVHSLLHVCGFDHTTEAEAKEMESMERNIHQQLKNKHLIQ